MPDFINVSSVPSVAAFCTSFIHANLCKCSPSRRSCQSLDCRSSVRRTEIVPQRAAFVSLFGHEREKFQEILRVKIALRSGDLPVARLLAREPRRLFGHELERRGEPDAV